VRAQPRENRERRYWDGERKASGNHGINSNHMATGVSQRPPELPGASRTVAAPSLVVKRAQRADRVNHSGCQRPTNPSGFQWQWQVRRDAVALNPPDKPRQ